VRSINVKEELAPDARTPEEKLKAAMEELTMKVKKEGEKWAAATLLSFNANRPIIPSIVPVLSV
jgi:hypothetical protein